MAEKMAHVYSNRGFSSKADLQVTDIRIGIGIADGVYLSTCISLYCHSPSRKFYAGQGATVGILK